MAMRGIRVGADVISVVKQIRIILMSIDGEQAEEKSAAHNFLRAFATAIISLNDRMLVFIWLQRAQQGTTFPIT